MAKQTINIGTTANDGTGDPLRTALDKVNANFAELYGVTANYMMMINGSGNVVASGIYQSASGNLLIGTTTDDGTNKLQVNGSVKANSGTLGIIQVGSDVGGGYIFQSSATDPLRFMTNSLERARITPSGNLLVGTTTDDGVNKLQVNGGIAFAPSTTTTAPAAGGAGALPATPLGYATITINGTARKIAYYA